jgi:DNA-binding beta-propeller fold protein YncE
MNKGRALIAAFALITVLFLTVAGNSFAASPGVLPRDSSAVSHRIATSTAGRVLASCLVGNAVDDAYDPADGNLYVADSLNGWISIVKPPCTIVSTIYPVDGGYISGVAYDPLTKEMVAIDSQTVKAYVIRGTALVDSVSLGAFPESPDLAAWDAETKSLLIADGGGIDMLHLDYANGSTHASVKVEALDNHGNDPYAVLVADGYIFSAGGAVDVFNDRSLAYLGQFKVNGGTSLAWDPLNDTVVVGKSFVTHDTVVFLQADGVRSGKFTYTHFAGHDILFGGVGGVAYSPATREVYMTANEGVDVWELSESGALTHVYLGQDAFPQLLTYVPSDHEMYVCGYGTNLLYAIQ